MATVRYNHRPVWKQEVYTSAVLLDTQDNRLGWQTAGGLPRGMVQEALCLTIENENMTADTSKDAIVPVNSTVTSLSCFSIPSSCATPGGYPSNQLLQFTTCWCHHILPISQDSGYNDDTKLPFLLNHDTSFALVWKVSCGRHWVFSCFSYCTWKLWIQREAGQSGCDHVFFEVQGRETSQFSHSGRLHIGTSPVSIREKPRVVQYIIKDGN